MISEIKDIVEKAEKKQWEEQIKNARPSDKKCTVCGSHCVWVITHERIEVLQCTKHENHQSIFGFTV